MLLADGNLIKIRDKKDLSQSSKDSHQTFPAASGGAANNTVGLNHLVAREKERERERENTQRCQNMYFVETRG